MPSMSQGNPLWPLKINKAFRIGLGFCVAVLWGSPALGGPANVSLKCEDIAFELTPLLIMRDIEQDRSELFWEHDLDLLRQSISLLHKKAVRLDIASDDKLWPVDEIADTVFLLNEMNNTLNAHTITHRQNLRDIILEAWLPELSKIISQLDISNHCDLLQVNMDFENGAEARSPLQDHIDDSNKVKGSQRSMTSTIKGGKKKVSDYLTPPSKRLGIVSPLSASNTLPFVVSLILILVALRRLQGPHKKTAKQARETRYPTKLKVIVKVGTLSTTATIVDLSKRGAKIRCDGLPTKTNFIFLLFQEKKLKASVKWSNDYYAGLLFKRPLKEETLVRLLYADTGYRHQ